MRIITTGSIATDHLMSFGGLFADQLREASMDHLSVSLLVDELAIHRGGTGANVSYAAGLLGVRPALVGAVGADFDGDGRAWLESHGVDTRHIYVSPDTHTARWICTTDRSGAQIGTFYAGAMSHSSRASLAAVVDTLGGIDIVVLSADAPDAMLARADECRAAGWPHWADIGQQVGRFTGEEALSFIDGAAYLFTNAYEAELLAHKTGQPAEALLERVGAWVITHGADAIEIRRASADTVVVPVVPVANAVDPTGAGDAFRGGFLAAHTWGLPDERAAQVGAAVAAASVEAPGPQEYRVTVEDVVARLRAAYGDDAAEAVARASAG